MILDRTHGESIGRGGIIFKRGRWQSVELEVLLNRIPGDGTGSRISCRVDDKKIEITDTKLRSNANLLLNGIFISSFFGGTDLSWATLKHTYVDFRNFHLVQIRG